MRDLRQNSIEKEWNFTLNKTEKYQLSADYYYIFQNIVIFSPINIEKFDFPKSLKWPKQFCEPGSGTFSTSANIVRRTLNLCPNHKLVFRRYLLFSLCSVAHSGCTAIQDRWGVYCNDWKILSVSYWYLIPCIGWLNQLITFTMSRMK